MFVTLEKFFNDYRIKNGQSPNETVLNRGTMRLKREIRELKTYYDLMQGKDIEPWEEDRVYEVDEYVDFHGLIYRSKIDGNYKDIPDQSETWEHVFIKKIENNNNYLTLKSNTFTSEQDQTRFNLDFNATSIMVFLDGVLQDRDTYEYEMGVLAFKQPLEAGRTIVAVSSIGYESALLLPKREFKAEQDQYEFEVDFDLTMPSVFVNGKLLPEKDYIYTSRSVELNEPVNAGTYVVVCNGNTTGSNIYTKTEIDELLTHYFKDADVYTKTEIDDLKNLTLEQISSLYRLKSDSYSISEIDSKFIAYYNKTEIDNKLALYAPKSDSLSGYGILDAYTKTEIDEMFTNYGKYRELLNLINQKANIGESLSDYGIQDAYTKTEVNYFLNLKADKGSTLSEYGIDDAYTKFEIDQYLNKINTQLENLDISDKLAAYALKSDSLNGYGILDAYTKTEIDELLSANLDKEKVIQIINELDLDAKYLDGFSSDQYLRSDIKDEQYGGVTFYNSSELDNQRRINLDVNDEVPNIELSYKAEPNAKSPQQRYAVDERVFDSNRSNDLVFIAEGDFSGTFMFNLFQLGINLPQVYNWVVTVIPLQQGDSLDFIPKQYNSGYNFTTHKYSKSEYESSFYNYGFITDNVVRCYSYYKSGETFIETPAHYILTGYKYCISKKVIFNQGDSALQTQKFNWNSDSDVASIYVQNSLKKVDKTVPRILEPQYDNYGEFLEDVDTSGTVNTEKNISQHLIVETSVNEITNSETFFIIVRNGTKDGDVTFTIRGDAELVRCDSKFNSVGTATLQGRGKSPYKQQIVVTAQSPNCVSDFAVINLSSKLEDDPDTTLNFDNNGLDYTVFTSTDENLYTDDPDTTLNLNVNNLDTTVFTNNGN